MRGHTINAVGPDGTKIAARLLARQKLREKNLELKISQSQFAAINGLALDARKYSEKADVEPEHHDHDNHTEAEDDKRRRFKKAGLETHDIYSDGCPR